MDLDSACKTGNFFFPLVVHVCPALFPLISVWEYEIYRANSLCGHVTQHVLMEPSPSECCVTNSNRNPLDGALNTGLKRKEYGLRKELVSSMLSGIWKSHCLSVLVLLGVPELLCNSVISVSIQEIAKRTGCHTDEKAFSPLLGCSSRFLRAL